MTRLPHLTRLTAFVVAGVLLTTACRPAWDSFGASPSQGQTNGVSFADALRRRFVSVERTPVYAAARAKLGKRALSPSLVFDDTTAWTSRPDAKNRFLMAEGASSADGHYHFTPRAIASYPDRLASARHLTQLTKLAREGEFEWRTSVDFAIGSMTPSDWGSGFRALFASAEGRSDGNLRADVRSTLPRTTAALGRMFSLDTLHAQKLADGSTAVTLFMTVHPDWLKVQFPQYAKFVDKYVSPSAYHIVLRDTRNVRWLDLKADDRWLAIRLRVQNGGLVPLDGAVRAMPDTLQMTMDASTKFSIFTIAMRGMQGSIVFLRSPTERGWAMRFDKAPEWQLPLFVGSMLRTPLRRPFEQGGVVSKLSFRTGANGQTWISRDFRVAVQESAVTRFLGGFSGAAFSEFDGPAEVQENQFNAELFQALREDLKGLRYGSLPDLAPAKSGS